MIYDDQVLILGYSEASMFLKQKLDHVKAIISITGTREPELIIPDAIVLSLMQAWH